jgi:hypothetical protein
VSRLPRRIDSIPPFAIFGQQVDGALPPPPAEPRAPVYADMPTPIAPATHDAGPIYSVASLSNCGLVLEAERFYDPLYRSTLRALVAHIIRVEGPIFEDIMIRRVARAHGFAQTGSKIQAAVLKAVDPRFPRSEEGDRRIYWPEGSDPSTLRSFRPSRAAERDHGDVPLIELASLARGYLDSDADQDETLRLMARDFALGRLREPTRIRLLSAIALATRDQI